ncbi:MAG TPA: RNA 3'-terminal phosphate cyclase [Myxococcales bacterium]|jgi:RNA 3'-terminal phosphate cyclase (ATP)|nr:RNA 3'-terminal phosphate cyclase [Myxococcales bacterium]
MREIDGSRGEGGGQVLRTSLTLSLLSGEPLKIVNIRAGRQRPGLLRQHLCAVKLAAEVGNAELEGAEAGSRELTFKPRALNAGDYQCSVGTAGSATLVLQTVLPALLLAKGRSTLTLEGGTHNPLAPPFDFLARAFLPLLDRMGVRIEATLERHGFYPAGGGRMRVVIEPGPLQPLMLRERGAIVSCSATALLAALPASIAHRELSELKQRLGWPMEQLKLLEVDRAFGPGNVLFAAVESEHVTEVFTAFGEKSVRAEQVAASVAGKVQQYLAAGVPVGQQLADQLLLPMALAKGGAFRTLPLTEHARTQLELLRELYGASFAVREESGVVDISLV